MPRTNPIDRVRKTCLALPEATEKLSHGEPTWFVRGKVFASWEDHHHGDPTVGLWVNAPMGLQEMLVSAEPARYYRPKYVGHRGWIGINMEGDIDWPYAAELMTDSYRMVAPKRVLALLDSGVK
jgi:hypothetical protein